MTLIYLILSFSIAIVLFINKNKAINLSLISLFVILQWAYTIYACFHFRNTELNYFTFDSLGILLLITLSIISIPAMIHSFIYIRNNNKETPQSRGIYFAAIVGLITAISAGYLANHIAVIWIFTELTTLCASALIYHHRNKLALEVPGNMFLFVQSVLLSSLLEFYF